ncbi:MAG: hypothetical protein ACU0BF_04495 [Paracoccaceae bacterium]
MPKQILIVERDPVVALDLSQIAQETVRDLTVVTADTFPAAREAVTDGDHEGEPFVGCIIGAAYKDIPGHGLGEAARDRGLPVLVVSSADDARDVLSLGWSHLPRPYAPARVASWIERIAG